MDAKADTGVIATACLYRTARFAASAAELLGRADDAERWGTLAATTRTAFRQHYLEGDGRIRSDAQAVYGLAIHFGLLEDAEAQRAGDRLSELVAEGGYRVATGFAGTPYVVWALTETGHTDDAYRLLLQDQVPSWLYAVEMGATTIWERWDSLLPDGSVNPGEMTSFNHYALGAVVDWLYKRVAGIRPAEPGYARIRLEPTPGPGLDWARGALDTRRGRIESGWERQPDGGIVVTCLVPEGTEADLVLPDGTSRVLAAGAHRIECGGGAGR
jgi:alpha-L-rhamnosidase